MLKLLNSSPLSADESYISYNSSRYTCFKQVLQSYDNNKNVVEMLLTDRRHKGFVFFKSNQSLARRVTNGLEKFKGVLSVIE